MTKTNDPFDLGDEWCPECQKIVKVQEIYHVDYSQWVCDECGYIIDEDYDNWCEEDLLEDY
jgi:hypothetical protein